MKQQAHSGHSKHAEFVPQSEIATLTTAVQGRISKFKDDEPLTRLVESAIEQYFKRNPNGEQVTLAVLQSVGRDKVNELSAQHARKADVIKQEIGMYVVAELVSMYGAERVLTYRRPDNTAPSVRAVPKAGWGNLHIWVSRYTPHRLVAEPVALNASREPAQNSSFLTDFDERRAAIKRLTRDIGLKPDTRFPTREEIYDRPYHPETDAENENTR